MPGEHKGRDSIIWRTWRPLRELDIRNSEDLRWTQHINVIAKKAHQQLYVQRRLRWFNMSLNTPLTFYMCMAESILTGCVLTWFGAQTPRNEEELRKWYVLLASSQVLTSQPAKASTEYVASKRQLILITGNGGHFLVRHWYTSPLLKV